MTGKRFLFVLAAAAVVVTGAFFLLSRLRDPGSPGNSDGEAIILADRRISDIREIRIRNQYGAYSAWQSGGMVSIADLPMDEVNPEYAWMLFDEASRIEYRSRVTESPEHPEQYGLDPPLAEVTVRYNDEEEFSFCLGNEEKISAGRYLMVKGSSSVLLMENSRAVRFVMPLTRYINYEIVPFTGFRSPLNSVKKLTLSGQAFPELIVIEEVRADSPEQMRDVASFGVATHLIRSPALHEIDQKECIEVFASLGGLLNKDVLAYNCSDEALAAYGFGNPWAQAEFDFRQDTDTESEHIVLRVARYQGEYIVVRDDQRTVHRIENEAFIETSYERLAMRWFLTPFITDLHSLELILGGERLYFTFSGESNRTIEVLLNGKPLDIVLFRKFYALLISAANDGVLLKQPVPKTAELMALTFTYKDELKIPDVMKLFEGTLRRLNVQVNGRTEFTMLRRYLTVLSAAADALIKGNDFAADW